jgi:hypothetical protein
VPPGTAAPGPEHAVELSAELRQAVRFYRECRAVGRFPDDPLVRWCAAAIRAAEDHCERVRARREQLGALAALSEAIR